jgi:hypothetical protein
MKTMLVVMLLILTGTQVGCGNNCAGSITWEGTDATSGVKFVVEGTRGHHTESASDYCVFDTSKIEIIAPSGLTYEYGPDSTSLSSTESAKVMALFPQFSDVHLSNPIVDIWAPIADTFASVGVYVSDGGGEYIDQRVRIDLSLTP